MCSFISPHPPCSWRGSCNTTLKLPSYIPLPPTHQPLILSQGALAEREGAWVLQREKHPKVSVKWQERCQHTGNRSLLFLTACTAGLGDTYHDFLPFLPPFFPSLPAPHDIQERDTCSEGRKETKMLFLGTNIFCNHQNRQLWALLLWAK